MSRAVMASAVLMTAAGCHHHHGQPKPNMCLQTHGPCQGLICGGGNSPYTNIFPVNGLSSSGACNSDEIQLMPGSLHGGDCGDHATLEIDSTQTQLIGTKNGARVCAGKGLEHASFTLRSGGASVELMIETVKPITEGLHSYEGYRIVRHGKPACDYDESLEILEQLGFHPKHPPPNFSPVKGEGSNADYVVAMGGPIYDVVNATVIPHEGEGFFNLACAGDALAKTAFFDLRDHETAALRMITAKYATNHAYTVRGMMIDWKKFHTTDQPPPTEAFWDADGKVLCLEHPRLLDLKDDTGQIVPAQQLPAQPAGCTSDPKGGPPGTCDQQHWVENLQKESNVAGKTCASVPAGTYVLQSWSDPSGKLILTPKNQPPVTSPPPESAPTNRDPAVKR